MVMVDGAVRSSGCGFVFFRCDAMTSFRYRSVLIPSRDVPVRQYESTSFVQYTNFVALRPCPMKVLATCDDQFYKMCISGSCIYVYDTCAHMWHGNHSRLPFSLLLYPAIFNDPERRDKIQCILNKGTQWNLHR